jgi:hypothetical protein
MIGGLLKSASSTALFAALGLIALGAGAPAAKAADLGGDCCADLEERVAELEATTARKGNRKVSLTISGQVTTGVIAWESGTAGGPVLNPITGQPTIASSDVYVVDWTPAGGSYVSFDGRAKVSPSLTAGYQLTLAIATGARSQQVHQLDDDGGAATDSTIALTLANWYLDHKSFGRLTVGRINTSTAGLTTIDLGGAGVTANASIGYWNQSYIVTAQVLGGLLDANSAVGGWSHLLGGNTVNGASLSRANAIMYTSPVFGGFSVSASWGEDNMWDAALRYAGEHAGFRIAGGIGYRYNYSGTGEVSRDNPGDPIGCALFSATVGVNCNPEQVIASLSILHVSSGLFATGAYVNQDNDIAGREDTTLWYVQAGISKNWTGLGKTVFYGEYSRVENGAENFSNNGVVLLVGPPAASTTPSGIPAISSTAEMWGIGVVQHIDAAAMELYLSYRKYRAEFDGIPSAVISIDDLDMVVGGARIKF